MATFYLLPPRPLLGDFVADFLHTLLPGLDWDSDVRANLADAVASAAEVHAGVYVIFRDEIPAGESPESALADGFGAEAGDDVVEVRPAGTPGGLTSRRWRVGYREAA